MEQKSGELTSDEVWLLKLISTGEPKTPSKVNAAVKAVREFQDPQAMLSSLRQRGFIYYNDWNDVVIALPKAYQYLATYEASSETTAAEFVAEPQEPQESQNNPEGARKPSLAFLLSGLFLLLIILLVVVLFVEPRKGITRTSGFHHSHHLHPNLNCNCRIHPTQKNVLVAQTPTHNIWLPDSERFGISLDANPLT